MKKIPITIEIQYAGEHPEDSVQITFIFQHAYDAEKLVRFLIATQELLGEQLKRFILRYGALDGKTEVSHPVAPELPETIREYTYMFLLSSILVELNEGGE